MNKRSIFFIMALILGLILSGCGLFNNDVDNGNDIVEEQKIADFLNSMVNSMESLVHEFIDKTEEEAGDLEFPDADDLDFSDLFGHLDEFLDGPGGWDEEDLMEMIIGDLEDFVWVIVSLFNIEAEDFNDTEIDVDFQYKYFIELPSYYIFEDQDYPQEELRFVIGLVERTITVEDQEEKNLLEIEALVVEYNDGFRAVMPNLGRLIELWD